MLNMSWWVFSSALETEDTEGYGFIHLRTYVHIHTCVLDTLYVVGVVRDHKTKDNLIDRPTRHILIIM